MTDRLAGLSFFFPARNEELNVQPSVSRALEVLPEYAERLERVVRIAAISDAFGHGP